MRLINQSFRLLALSIATLRSRVAVSAILICSIAGVVAVLIGVAAVVTGYRQSMTGTARSDRALLLSAGADNELASLLSRQSIQQLGFAPAIGTGSDGRALVSPEALAVVDASLGSGQSVRVKLRGVSAELRGVRPETELRNGAWFNPGLRELMVGRSLRAQHPQLSPGTVLRTDTGAWKIVGEFTSGGDSREGEFLADVGSVLSAYQRNSYQSATVVLSNARAFTELKGWLDSQPALGMTAVVESEYREEQAKTLNGVFRFMATIVTAIMAVGACFVALNAMYAAVDGRRMEIATLQALGFRGLPVLYSIVGEAVLLALFGGIVGVLISLLVWSGSAVSTDNSSIAESAFTLTIASEHLAYGVALAIIIGLIGGLLPAMQALRTTPAVALRGN